MEVGVRTRSRAALAKAVQSSKAAKRRKVKEFAKLTKTTSFVELGDSRTVAAERSAGDRKNPISDIDHEAQVSCCSSNYGSREIADDNHNHERDDFDGQKIPEENQDEEEEDVFVDLKDDESNEVEASSTSNSCRERREMKLREESDGVESTSKPSVVNSDRRSSSASSSSSSSSLKMPSESELEEFFAAAEKDIQKRFADKYNFDIVKDTPMEGRYEWVRLKP